MGGVYIRTDHLLVIRGMKTRERSEEERCILRFNLKKSGARELRGGK